MKETDADRAVRNDVYRVTREELRQFIERAERLEAERKDLAEQKKEVFGEAKARGYDVAAIKRLIRERAKDPDDRAEAEAVFQIYAEAMGFL